MGAGWYRVALGKMTKEKANEKFYMEGEERTLNTEIH